MALTFAKYVLQPFFPDCSIPPCGEGLLAAATICEYYFNFLNILIIFHFYLFYSTYELNVILKKSTICIIKISGFLTFVNCYDVKETTKMQNMFMFAKIGALIIIILTGLAWLFSGM